MALLVSWQPDRRDGTGDPDQKPLATLASGSSQEVRERLSYSNPELSLSHIERIAAERAWRAIAEPRASDYNKGDRSSRTITNDPVIAPSRKTHPRAASREARAGRQ